jgi:hypothetical protein
MNASVNLVSVGRTHVVRSSRSVRKDLRWKEATKRMLMEAERGSDKTQASRRTILASLAALGSVVIASSCCLPLLPFLFAAGAAGTSAFFVRVRPFLLAASVMLIAFGFYQKWRAKQCQCKPNLLSTVLLWFSAVVVLAFILFPQAIANILANLLAG